MTYRTPLEDVVVGGLDDWIYETWVSNSVWNLTPPQNRRTVTLGLIAELLVSGLMIPGTVDRQGHHPWTCSIGDSIERIVREWITDWGQEVPTPGAIVWLDNTEMGDELARAVLAREAG
ncbi:hypothetical protein [uncultured Microbacterium sp.]|uniref:hypothetical protein n=1 Tax=uncultured Microbacterium sp. TaxID=191216 RepID=UPI0025F42B57|nr:hypothetical protein [uncultured Microbacterium sp.]